MPYDDKDLGIIFPTRKGEPIGSDNERTMIDNIEGSDQIRTSVRISEDENGCKKTVRLRTRWGYPDFITEKACKSSEETSPVYMDSGIVDMFSVVPDSPPLDIQSAPLYYGNTQRSYATNHKLLGRIFPPNIDADTPPVEAEPGWSFDTTRGDVVGKKEAAAKCPPSMFTGKARLYAQAIYGADLKNWKWTLTIPEGLSPRLVHDNGSVLFVNSGIYRDATYIHWMISIYPDGILITKLVRDNKVDSLVTKLKDPAFAADHDKIEAYILAYSTPSTTMTFVLDVPVPETQMLGYGWKFNWAGNKADIIQHTEGFPNHVSTHYRFTFLRDTNLVGPNNTPEQEAARWSAVLSVVEGPVSWHNFRYAQVVASPDWLFNLLYLFGTNSGGATNCDAPIYCFYNKADQLELFRYSNTNGVSGVKYMVTSQPAQWMYPVDWTSENLSDYTHFGSAGLKGAEGERRVRSLSPTSTGFYFSSGTCVVAAQNYTFDRYTLSEKTIVSDGSTWATSNVGHNAYEHSCAANDTGWSPYYVTTDGVQRYSSGVEIINDLGDFLGYAVGDYNQVCVIGYDRYEYHGNHNENFTTLLLVPFHDAEAAYIWGNVSTNESATVSGGYCEGTNQPGFFAWRETEVFSDGKGGYTYYKYYVFAGGDGTYLAVNNTPRPELNETTDSNVISLLVTKHGNYPFSPPDSMSPFFAGVPYVEKQYYTHSAAVGPVVYGHGANNLDGFPASLVLTSPPPFLGWA